MEDLRQSAAELDRAGYLPVAGGGLVRVDRRTALLDGGDAGAAAAAGAGAAGLRPGAGAVEDECSGGAGWGEDAVELGWVDAAEPGVPAAPHAVVAGCDLPLDGAPVHLGQAHAGVGDGGAGGGGGGEEDAAGLVPATVSGYLGGDRGAAGMASSGSVGRGGAGAGVVGVRPADLDMAEPAAPAAGGAAAAGGCPVPAAAGAGDLALLCGVWGCAEPLAD